MNIWRRALDRGLGGGGAGQSEGAGIPPRGQWAWCGWEEKGDRMSGMTRPGDLRQREPTCPTRL